MTTLSEHLAFVRAELNELSARADRITQNLNAEQLTRRPKPGAWSIAECLDHLAVTNAAYRAPLERALASGGARSAANVHYRPGFLARLFLKGSGPVVVVPIKSPKVFQPASFPNARALEAFRAEQEKLLDLTMRARDVDLTRLRISSPVSGLFRFNVAEALHLIVLHEQRHIAQAERVLQTL